MQLNLLNNSVMKLKDQRRTNLQKIIDDDFSGVALRLADHLGMKPPQLHRWRSGGQGISEDSARLIEEKCNKPRGWLDIDHTARNTISGLMSDIASALEKASPEMRDAIFQLATKYQDAPEDGARIADAIKTLIGGK